MIRWSTNAINVKSSYTIINTTARVVHLATIQGDGTTLHINQIG